jgi:hypothetical protein
VIGPNYGQGICVLKQLSLECGIIDEIRTSGQNARNVPYLLSSSSKNTNRRLFAIALSSIFAALTVLSVNPWTTSQSTVLMPSAVVIAEPPSRVGPINFDARAFHV